MSLVVENGPEDENDENDENDSPPTGVLARCFWAFFVFLALAAQLQDGAPAPRARFTAGLTPAAAAAPVQIVSALGAPT